MNFSGFSLIGKWPRSFMMTAWCTGAARDFERALRWCGIVVFPGEQIEWARRASMWSSLSEMSPIDHVEIEVALEHAGAALHVVATAFPSGPRPARWARPAPRRCRPRLSPLMDVRPCNQLVSYVGSRPWVRIPSPMMARNSVRMLVRQM